MSAGRFALAAARRAAASPRAVAARQIGLAARSLSMTARASSQFKDPFPLPLSDPDLAARRSREPPTTERWATEGDNPDEIPRPEPIVRHGEDEARMRARLVYQTRKRGTLETDLILSTFARDELANMTMEEMAQFDKLLDEPDWDIFYWAIQKKEPPAKWKDTSLLAKLQKHARNEGKVVRTMPALGDSAERA